MGPLVSLARRHTRAPEDAMPPMLGPARSALVLAACAHGLLPPGCVTPLPGSPNERGIGRASVTRGGKHQGGGGPAREPAGGYGRARAQLLNRSTRSGYEGSNPAPCAPRQRERGPAGSPAGGCPPRPDDHVG